MSRSLQAALSYITQLYAWYGWTSLEHELARRRLPVLASITVVEPGCESDGGEIGATIGSSTRSNMICCSAFRAWTWLYFGITRDLPQHCTVLSIITVVPAPLVLPRMTQEDSNPESLEHPWWDTDFRLRSARCSGPEIFARLQCHTVGSCPHARAAPRCPHLAALPRPVFRPIRSQSQHALVPAGTRTATGTRG
eukprot:COSAG02_NODE_862_length_16418_cov_5.730621_13_plen_195_part_00